MITEQYLVIWCAKYISLGARKESMSALKELSKWLEYFIRGGFDISKHLKYCS